MSAALAAALALAASLASGASAGALQPCEGLAAYARTLPADAWAKGGAQALAPRLRLDDRSKHKPTPLEAALAKSPKLRTALGLEGTEMDVDVSRLAGTDLYAATSVQGTLECQTTVFVRAVAGRPFKVIKDPPTLDQTDLCWTRGGSFGQVDGRAAFIVYGANSQTDDDEDIDIMPWTGTAWGPACRVELRFRTDYTITDSYCGDKGVCEAAGRVARDIAAAYGTKRKAGGDAHGFAWGPPASSKARAAVQTFAGQVYAQHYGTGTTDFPTFGKDEGHDFSYNGFALFPLKLAGQEYLAAIGHEGVGWRESADTLLAVYRLDDGEPVPLAGFVIPRSVSGLASARAAPAPLAEAH
jgi:hypothetical protein